MDDEIIAIDDEETRLAFLKHCENEFPGISKNSEDAFSFLGMAILFDYKSKIIKYDNLLCIKELSDSYDIQDENQMQYRQDFMSSDQQDITMSNIIDINHLLVQSIPL